MNSESGLPRNYLERRLEPVLRAALTEFKAVAITGARQVGKSTLAKAVIGPGVDASYLTLDNALLREAANEDPVGFVGRLPRHAVIDEVQRAPELMLAIKERLDSDDSPGQLIVTGSADLRNMSRIKDTLPGRIIYLELWPFLQAEIEASEADLVTTLFSEDPTFGSQHIEGREPYAERVVLGGYPGVGALSARGKEQFFEAFVMSMVDHQLDGVAEVRDPEALARLLRLIAARSGRLLNANSLAGALGRDQKTVQRYLKILSDLFVAFELPVWHSNLGQRLTKAPKLYVRDTGLLAYLTGADQRAIIDDLAGDRAGMFIETFAVMELVRLAQLASPAVRCYHYRDKAKREVDLLLERADGKVVAVEVKAASTVRSTDFKVIRYLRENLGEKFVAGVVLHLGRDAVGFGEKLFALPLASLWDS